MRVVGPTLCTLSGQSLLPRKFSKHSQHLHKTFSALSRDYSSQPCGLQSSSTRRRLADPEYSRCGRTDKGVSALSQVFALQLRSSAKVGDVLPEVGQELEYMSILNRVLPPDIKVLGWRPVSSNFSARFDATQRGYKYFIVQHGELDIGAMQEAASYFLGEHDFRSFCKADVQHVSNFKRTILDFRIQPEPGISIRGFQVMSLHIKGTAFLWHQVRCMAAVLMMVGRGQESPKIVQQLLDIHQHPCKPQYNMANEVPLMLHSCSFQDLQFHQPAAAQQGVQAAAQEALDHHIVMSAMYMQLLEKLKAGQKVPPETVVLPLTAGQGPRHLNLLLRAVEPCLEERLAKFHPPKDGDGVADFG
ncbi:hypothetical protein WJX84_007703 [Apatococcus fuscideae]|uniref:tRNA pseudouridine synthase n=1 Tax=Apatococcus fuscideae TaxID=2026836 RepID=A0AAW1SN01_9CHLO